jgi:hypothetical protein
VSAAFQACAKLTTIDGSNDRPNRTYAYNPTHVKWSVVGDPTAGSKVTWDGQSGSYKVTGDFDMTATYDGGFGGRSSKAESGGSHTAHAFLVVGAGLIAADLGIATDRRVVFM